MGQFLIAVDSVSIADATPIKVCHNLRIHAHRVFRNLAQRGKSSTGWFFGFKLHVIINHLGETVCTKLTPANVCDRKPLAHFCDSLFGKLYADKGYLSKKLAQSLKDKGIELITKVRRNMKPIPQSDFDRAVLRKRGIIETVFDQLKNLCQIEHSRHRSPCNFAVNLMAGLSAYCLNLNKPKLPLDTHRQLKD